MKRAGLLNNVNVDILHSLRASTLHKAINRFCAKTQDNEALRLIKRGYELALSDGGELWIDGHRDAIDKFSRMLSQRKEPKVALGGNAGICAASLATLGVESYLSACIRDDRYGRFVERTLDQHGVNLQYLIRKDRRGLSQAVTYGLEVDSHDRCFLADGGDNRRLNVSDHFVEAMKTFDVLLVLGSHNLREGLDDLIALIEGSKCTLITDSGDLRNTRPEETMQLYSQADIACFNEIELSQVSGRDCSSLHSMESAAAELSSRMENAVCVHFPKGAICASGKKLLRTQAFVPSRVNTRTGLGDAFVAGFAFGLAITRDSVEGIKRGLVLGNASASLRMESGKPATLAKLMALASEREAEATEVP
ncbi:MAG: carbohydrate kinase family protein [Thermoplasmata archaeon]